MITLTPEEAAILQPKYDEYLASFKYRGYGAPLSFDEWWRAMADQMKEEGKYL